MAGGLFSNGATPSVVDCEAFFDSGIPKLVGGILQMGVLVAVGTTRDRGAISITITADGAFDREYFRDVESAEDYLRRADESLRAMGLGQRVTGDPVPPKPTRRRQKLS